MARASSAAAAERLPRAVAAPARPAQSPRRRTGPATPAARRLRVAVPAAPSPTALLDGLLRGRAWVLCVGALLAGIVFFNVSLLELNSGIARTSERAAALKRDNASLRTQVADLGSSERIQTAAAERGFVLPAPGDVAYLRADATRDADRAAKTMTEPKPPEAPAAAAQMTPAAPAAPTSAAPATATDPATAAPAAPAATTAAPAPTTAAPAPTTAAPAPTTAAPAPTAAVPATAAPAPATPAPATAGAAIAPGG